RDDRGLDAVARAGLGEDATHVVLDRRLGEEQLRTDLRVGQTGPDGGQDLAFTAGEVADGVVGPSAVLGGRGRSALALPSGQASEQAAGRTRGDDRVTGGNRA